MSTLERRKASIPQRSIESAVVDCRTADGTFSARISNVTLAGLQLSASRAAEKGERIEVVVSNETTAMPHPSVVVSIRMRSEVTWCKAAGEGFAWGVRFLYDGVHDMAAFVRFIYREYAVRLWEWPDKRAYPRVSRKLVCYYVDDDGVMQLAMLRDLSVTGIGLVTMLELKSDAETTFRFGVAEDMVLERRGRVMRSRRTDRGFDVGVKFVDTSDEEFDELVRAIARAAEL